MSQWRLVRVSDDRLRPSPPLSRLRAQYFPEVSLQVRRLTAEAASIKVSTISINKKKAVVISQHPENSYELVYDEDNSKVVAYLRILNPTQFWQYPKYLVISTK